MKQWVRKCGGVLFASLLTVLLNGKAYADSELQLQEAPTKIVEPAAPPWKVRPSRAHSSIAKRISSCHSGEPMGHFSYVKSVWDGPPTWKFCTPARPAAAKASRSAVMPSFVTQPSIHCQMITGFASCGGFSKTSCKARPASGAHPTATVTQNRQTISLFWILRVLENKPRSFRIVFITNNIQVTLFHLLGKNSKNCYIRSCDNIACDESFFKVFPFAGQYERPR